MRNRKVCSMLFLVLSGTNGIVQGGVSLEPLDISDLPLRLPCEYPNPSRWQAGVHYNVVLPRAPAYVVPGRVSVRELSMYTTWITPTAFRSEFDAWLKKNASQVAYTREPSIVAGMAHAKLQAQMFFTLDELGRENLHEMLRDWIQDPKEGTRWDIYHNVRNPDRAAFLKLNMEFIRAQGIEERAFLDIYESPAIAQRVLNAEGTTAAAVVQGTPTFVINERYSVSAQRLMKSTEAGKETMYYFSRLLELLDYLTMSELSCQVAKSSGI